MASGEIPQILKLEIKFKTLEDRISLDFDKEIFLFRIGELNNILSIYFPSENLSDKEKKVNKILEAYINVLDYKFKYDFGTEEYEEMFKDKKSKNYILYDTLINKKLNQLKEITNSNFKSLELNSNSEDMLLYIADEYLIEIPTDPDGKKIPIDKIEFNIKTLKPEETNKFLNIVYGSKDIVFEASKKESREIYKYTIKNTNNDVTSMSWNDSNKLFHQNTGIINGNIFPRSIPKNNDITITPSVETKDLFLRLFYGIHKNIGAGGRERAREQASNPAKSREQREGKRAKESQLASQESASDCLWTVDWE